MTHNFYIQVVLVSKDTILIKNYEQVLNASSKFLLTKDYDSITEVLQKKDLLNTVSAFIFDAQTMGIQELVKLKTQVGSKKILVVDSGPDNMVNILKIGVGGYLSRKHDYGSLLDFVWKVSNGEKALDQDSLKYLLQNLEKNMEPQLWGVRLTHFGVPFGKRIINEVVYYNRTLRSKNN